MGDINNYFVAAAILLDNPGVDVWEFDRLVNSVGEREKDYPGFGSNLVPGSFISPNFHNGIFSTCQNLLHLPERDPFYFFQNPNDPLQIDGVEAILVYDGCWKEPRFRRIRYAGQRLDGQIHEVESESFYPFKAGMQTSERFLGGSEVNDIEVFDLDSRNRSRLVLKDDSPPVYVVRDIVSSQRIDRRQVGEEVLPGEVDHFWVQRFRIQRVLCSYETESFENYASLVEKYPQYCVEKNYDLSLDKGELPTKTYANFGEIYWVSRNGRFYLDLEGILRNNQEKTYTAIVLTAEAIRHREWYYLSFRSGDEIDGRTSLFYLTHPDSALRHAQAVADFWCHRFAMVENLSWFEMVRRRAVGDLPGVVRVEDIGRIMEGVVLEAPRNLERMIKRMVYDRLAHFQPEPQKEEIPF